MTKMMNLQRIIETLGIQFLYTLLSNNPGIHLTFGDSVRQQQPF